MTNSQTKSRGILMSSWSIQKYMAGLKNQTRRTKGLDKINENPDEWRLNGILFASGKAMFTNVKNSLLHHVVTLPYGPKGGTLYFKETFQVYRRSGSVGDEWIGDEIEEYYGRLPKERDSFGFWKVSYRATEETPEFFKWWRSPLFMMDAYSRFRDIPITNVRVERLHDITEMDAMNEGCFFGNTSTGPEDYHKQEYFKIWDSINGKKLPSSKNPWLFVYDFPFWDKANNGILTS